MATTAFDYQDPLTIMGFTVLTTATGLTGGTADSVTAMGLITPAGGDGVSGLILKSPSTTWGADGESPLDTDPDYGTGQFLQCHKEGSGTPETLLLARINRTGSFGTTGGIHVATGLRQRAGYTPTQCVWIDPTINTAGLVIHNPTVAESGTWSSRFIQCTDVRVDPAVEVFGITSDGTTNIPNPNIPHLPSRTRHRVFEHFEGAATVTTNGAAIGGTKAIASLVGTGSQCLQGASFVASQGSVGCTTGTTTTGVGGAAFTGAPVTFTAATTDMTFGARIWVNTLSTAGEQHEVRAGVMVTIAAAVPADALYFRLQHGDTNWEAVNRRAGTETVTDSGVASAAATWVNLQIRYAAGGNVTYYINGALVATISTNKPTDTTTLATTLIPVANIVKAAGTTSRTLYIDAMYLDHNVDINLEQILP